MNQRTQISFPVQFLLLLGLVGVGMVVGTMLAGALGASILDIPILQVPEALNKQENVNLSRPLNVLATLFAFLIPGYLFAKIVDNKPNSYLGFNLNINAKQIMLVVLITFGGMILSGSLGMLNQQIPLPEEWMKQARSMERKYNDAMLNMAHIKSVSDYILAMLVMALAPAIFEEVLFRGALQNLFVSWTKNAWVGIIITAILFSVIHISYFGFLPRFGLGMILGLIFYYSGSLWLSILLHFLNNAFVVTQLYVLTTQGKPIEQAMNDTAPIWWGLVALVLLIMLFKLLHKESSLVRKNSTDQEIIPAP